MREGYSEERTANFDTRIMTATKVVILVEPLKASDMQVEDFAKSG